eukprot:SAG22_NODE_331_length_12174_cov_12.920497_12_plen_137_part_00
MNLIANMQLDSGKDGLNVDVRNMFNELDRVSMMEDLLDSEELLGTDFAGLAPFVHMAYFGEYMLWYEVIDEPSDGGQPRRSYTPIASRRGVRQGGPLSCFLADRRCCDVGNDNPSVKLLGLSQLTKRDPRVPSSSS